MSTYTVHNIESAPSESKPLLENSIKGFGMIPNLHGVMAESPQLLEGYQILHSLAQKTSFSPTELTVVWQTINVEHECHYCVPAHTMIANMMEIPADVTEALRNETPLPTTELETLRDTVLIITRGRGVISKEQQEDFFQAGFTQQNVLEIILILSQKVMSNYTNHIAETAIDAPFQEFGWDKA